MRKYGVLSILYLHFDIPIIFLLSIFLPSRMIDEIIYTISLFSVDWTSAVKQDSTRWTDRNADEKEWTKSSAWNPDFVHG